MLSVRPAAGSCCGPRPVRMFGSVSSGGGSTSKNAEAAARAPGGKAASAAAAGGSGRGGSTASRTAKSSAASAVLDRRPMLKLNIDEVRLPLSQAAQNALHPTVAQLHSAAAGKPVPVEDILKLKLTPAQRAVCQQEITRPARERLENGAGCLLLQFPQQKLQYSPDQVRLLYYLVGQALGEVWPQNVQGTMLYDVTDLGKDIKAGARFSITKYETMYHTDASFIKEVVDYIGLACIRSAKSGGMSLVSDGYAVYDELARNHPADLETLKKPYHVDRRGGRREGESATVQYPVINFTPKGELLIRYLRGWIDAGHENANEPMTPAQKKALDTFDAVAKQVALPGFFLQPGDFFFTNNRWLLHNRTEFDDWPENERKRLLIRLWVKNMDRAHLDLP